MTFVSSFSGPKGIRVHHLTLNAAMNHLRGGNEVANKELKRGLEARHIQMIALGGTIGVGLFMGSASTIKWTGPSVMLAYAIAGVFIFFIMRAMGEMLYMEPSTGSLRHLVTNIFIR